MYSVFITDKDDILIYNKQISHKMQQSIFARLDFDSITRSLPINNSQLSLTV